jgi:hypothetical protein
MVLVRFGDGRLSGTVAAFRFFPVSVWPRLVNQDPAWDCLPVQALQLKRERRPCLSFPSWSNVQMLVGGLSVGRNCLPVLAL